MLVITGLSGTGTWGVGDAAPGCGNRTIRAAPLRLPAMLDRSLRLAFRNYSTLFLFVIVLVLPLHLAYTYVFRDVFTVSELHSQIANLTGGRRVHGVGPADLRVAQLTLLGFSLAELALVPFLARGARAALAADLTGGVPTAMGAWRGVFSSGRGGRRAVPAGFSSAGSPVAGVLGGLLMTLLVVFLVERIGVLAIQPLRGEQLWVAIGTVQAAARASGAPFLLAALALVAGRLLPRGAP